MILTHIYCNSKVSEGSRANIVSIFTNLTFTHVQEYPAAGAVASAVIVPDIFKYTIAEAGFNEYFLYLFVLHDAKLTFCVNKMSWFKPRP